MDYTQWAQAYFEEAEAIRAALAPIRAALKRPHLRVEESRELTRRERILYQMYLECRETGLLLQRRAS